MTGKRIRAGTRSLPSLTVLLALAGATASTPAFAQSAPTSTQILDLFVTRCAEIATEAQAAASVDFPSASGVAFQALGGGISADGAILFYSEQIELPDRNFVLLKFDQTKLPGATRTTCYLGLTGSTPDAYQSFAEMPVVAESRIDQLIGENAVRFGGEVSDPDEFRQVFRWISGQGTPSEHELRVAEGFGTIQLTLNSTATPVN
ncbi:hypothetical protein [Tabrizicola sp.]|uniref:hypothetical protein n=1 Tax=Tabrizicola sp. TaxID=2005166 RepID=UPI003F2A3391